MGQTAVMHHTVVDETRWIGETRFPDASRMAWLLPAVKASRLATSGGRALTTQRVARFPKSEDHSFTTICRNCAGDVVAHHADCRGYVWRR